MSTRLDLVIDTKAAYQKSFEYKQADGTPVDMAGYTGSMLVWDTATGALLLDLNTTNSKLQLLAGGIIKIAVPIEDVVAIFSPSGDYGLFLTSSYKFRLFHGHVSFAGVP